jgi:hypothetical protein
VNVLMIVEQGLEEVAKAVSGFITFLAPKSPM